MSERLIALPDEDLIKEFSMKKEDEKSPPDQLYVDGHIDLPYYMMKHTSDTSFEELDSGPFTQGLAIKSGFRLFVTAVYCQDRFNGESSFTHFQKNMDFAVRAMEKLLHVKNVSDIDTLKQDKEILGTFFLLENADALADNIKYTNSLREHNILIVGLTHIGTNRLADGNGVLHSEGITSQGREVIKVLIENNILIDVAHLHPACFRQILDLVETPLVSSHTGIRNICNIPRNLDMEQVRQIVEREGVVGITFNPEMLSTDKEADIELIFRHIDTIVQKYGVNHVGIGSDFCGFDNTASGMDNITGTKGLMEVMSSHGYKRDDINKIMGLNWIGVYERIL